MMRIIAIVGALGLMESFADRAVAADTKLGTAIESLAKAKQAKADLQVYASALEMYKLNAGVYPTEKQGLASLAIKPVQEPVPRRWMKIMEKLAKDPWGRDYRYIVRKEKEQVVHVIICDGAEIDKTTDDLDYVMEKAGK